MFWKLACSAACYGGMFEMVREEGARVYKQRTCERNFTIRDLRARKTFQRLQLGSLLTSFLYIVFLATLLNFSKQ